MIKHSIIRIFYFIFLAAIFYAAFTFFGYDITYKWYILFCSMYTVYYLMDYFNFNTSHLSAQETFLSFLINMITASGIFLFIPKILFFKIFFSIFIVQIASKYLILKFIPIVKKTLILYDKEEEEILDSSQYGDYIVYKRLPLGDNLSLKLGKIVRINNIDSIVITTTKKIPKNLLDRLYLLKLRGVEVFNSITFAEKVQKRLDINNIDQTNFVFTDISLYRSGFSNNLKRLLDLTIASLVLILSAPIVVILIFLIKVTSKGPAIYTQTRMGQNGKTFTIYKLRTMLNNAESAGAKWASNNDNRITKIGKVLRLLRLDELPQAINVIKGDMSLVGPRPERPEFLNLILKDVKAYNLRHFVKPGITGWAQINYRYGASVEDTYKKLTYDLYYIKHSNILFDLYIIVKTIGVMISAKGSR